MTAADLASSVANAPRRRLTNYRPVLAPGTHESTVRIIYRSGRHQRSLSPCRRRRGLVCKRSRAAWGELFRHFVGVDLDPFEVRRRIGHVDVADLEVLDFTDDRVRQRLGISIADLTSATTARGLRPLPITSSRAVRALSTPRNRLAVGTHLVRNRPLSSNRCCDRATGMRREGPSALSLVSGGVSMEGTRHSTLGVDNSSRPASGRLGASTRVVGPIAPA